MVSKKDNHCPVCFSQLRPLTGEDALQIEMVSFFRRLVGESTARIVHHANNQTNGIQGAKNKAMGVTAGNPDLEINAVGQKTFFIEVKFEKGVLSKVQKEEIARLESFGFKCYVIWSLKEFLTIIKQELW